MERKTECRILNQINDFKGDKMLRQEDFDLLYPFGIFKDNGVEFSWNTIKTGWDLHRLTVNEISLFALDYMEANPGLVNMYISEVIFGVKYYEMNEYLEKIFTSLNLDLPEKDGCLWNKEWRKWRFCILSTIVKYIEDEEDLVCKVDEIFADFGYPLDMKPLIYHMPTSHKLKFRDYKFLIRRIMNFIALEKVLIETGYEYSPQKIY